MAALRQVEPCWLREIRENTDFGEESVRLKMENHEPVDTVEEKQIFIS